MILRHIIPLGLFPQRICLRHASYLRAHRHSHLPRPAPYFSLTAARALSTPPSSGSPPSSTLSSEPSPPNAEAREDAEKDVTTTRPGDNDPDNNKPGKTRKSNSPLVVNLEGMNIENQKTINDLIQRTIKQYQQSVLRMDDRNSPSNQNGLREKNRRKNTKVNENDEKDVNDTRNQSGDIRHRHAKTASETDEQEEDNNHQHHRNEDPRKTHHAGQFLITVRPLWLALFAAMFLIGVSIQSAENARPETNWRELVSSMLERGAIDRIVIFGGKLAMIFLRGDAPQFVENPTLPRVGHQYFMFVGSSDSFERRLDEAQDELGINARDRVPVIYRQRSKLISLAIDSVPPLLIFSVCLWLLRRTANKFSGAGGGPGGILGMGKSRARLFNLESNVVMRFKDVAGIDEAKEEVMEFVKFLKEPEVFERLGARIPRGAILSGPPGTGKTLLAKATAGEAGVPFYTVSGSEFVEMFVGVGASRVRDLFNTARQNTPCIIFIDEIDAIGKRRSRNSGGFGGNDERESTLNQILVEIDGFTSSDHIVVLAGTNRPDVLDPALLRPGRFDRHIVIDRPDVMGRIQIFAVHMKPLRLSKDLDKEQLGRRLAALTPGFSGADIGSVCNEAALVAARMSATAVERMHFEQAIERVVAGLAMKTNVLSMDQRRIVAYHEAGHAIAGWYLEHADPLLKVSIIPRGSGALGYAQYVPRDLRLHSKEQLEDRVCMALAGRAAEEIFIKSITTGAQDDLKKVSKTVYAMLTRHGMSKKLGLVSFPAPGDTEDPQQGMTKPYSEATAQLIDTQAREIIELAYERALRLLEENKDSVHKVAARLLEKEVMSHDDMEQLLGERPFKGGFQIEEFVRGTQNADGSQRQIKQ